MTLGRSTESQTSEEWSGAEDQLDGFEAAWQRGPAPALDTFLASAGVPDNPGLRRRFLEELIKIDLGNRWRKNADRPRLEEYLRRHPDLAPDGDIALELIAEEYWSRHRWGDRPGHDEYLAAFPRHAAKLRAALARIDADLAKEFTQGRNRPAALPGLLDVPQRPATDPLQPPASAAALFDELRRHGLLPAVQLEELGKALSQFADPRSLAREVLRRGWLTPFQINYLMQGRGSDLLLGQYVLQERLGEGGMGQVYKALQCGLNRVVALKIIRRELLADPEALARFNREVHILGQLTHPNIVQRYDLGPVGGATVLAMEYVEGVDLARLVKQNGPLPMEKAIDYIHQAALGLEHAHGHGLVHRDIKPANLVLSKAPSPESRSQGRSLNPGLWTLDAGVIKILDLGLARLHRPPGGTKPGMNPTTVVTRIGATMMGTPDYFAPEQAEDFHAADVRADIYALGCTCYFLLTGRPPFPGGSLSEKLLRHREAEPTGVEEFRPDLPPGLPAVIRKMMAKRPQDRYQTPAEVARALEAFMPRRPVRTPAPWRRLQLLRKLQRRQYILAGGIAAGLLLLVGLIALLSGGKGTPSASITDESPAAALKRLRAQLDGPGPNFESIRQNILKLRLDNPSTAERAQAAELLMQLPSPLDKLSAVSAALPRGVAAVFGVPGPKLMVCVDVSPDCKVVAGGSEDGLVRLWHGATGRELAVFDKHKAPIHALAFAPDGQTLASAGRDGTVRLYGVFPPRELDVIASDTTLGLAWSPDGQQLALAGVAPFVYLWDVAKRREAGRLAAPGLQVQSISEGPDGRSLAGGLLNGTLVLWDVAAGKQRFTAKPSSLIHAVAFAPNGKGLAVAGEEPLIRLWDAATNKETMALQGTAPYSIYSLAFAPDGKSLASVDRNSEVVQWDVRSGNRLRQWALPGKPVRVAFASDGRHLVTANGDGTVYVVRLATGPRR